MIKRILIIIALLLFVLIFVPLIQHIPPMEEPGFVASHYLEKGEEELGAANLVTSVIVTYRGLDTLGEVAVLFAATAGVGLLMKKQEDSDEKKQESSEILQTGTGLLVPLLLLFGIYIFVHGHLTPGGGFQGGVVIASAVILLYLAGTAKRTRHLLLQFLESVSGFSYIVIGVLGIFLAGGFLDNRILPLGETGRLFSAGAIPVIYSLLGLKVGTELLGILDKLKGGHQ